MIKEGDFVYFKKNFIPQDWDEPLLRGEDSFIYKLIKYDSYGMKLRADYEQQDTSEGISIMRHNNPTVYIGNGFIDKLSKNKIKLMAENILNQFYMEDEDYDIGNEPDGYYIDSEKWEICND